MEIALSMPEAMAEQPGQAAPASRTAMASRKRPLDGLHGSEGKGVTWDEANLAEHDKERGTRRGTMG